MLARAKAAADARRWDEAAAIYRQAIAASPDSGFLYRDLAAVEQRAGQTANALEHYRKAIEIDAGDARSLAGIGAILESQGDVVGALAALRAGEALDPAEVPDGVAGAPARRGGAGETAGGVSRDSAPRDGDARRHRGADRRAARSAARARAAATGDHHRHPRTLGAAVDRAGGSRAASWTRCRTTNSSPSRLVRRGELATTVSRLLSLDCARRKPELRQEVAGAQVSINDVAPTHLSYPAVSAAVAAGVMSLSNGDFDLLARRQRRRSHRHHRAARGAGRRHDRAGLHDCEPADAASHAVDSGIRHPDALRRVRLGAGRVHDRRA